MLNYYDYRITLGHSYTILRKLSKITERAAISYDKLLKFSRNFPFQIDICLRWNGSPSINLDGCEISRTLVKDSNVVRFASKPQVVVLELD